MSSSGRRWALAVLAGLALQWIVGMPFMPASVPVGWIGGMVFVAALALVAWAILVHAGKVFACSA